MSTTRYHAAAVCAALSATACAPLSPMPAHLADRFDVRQPPAYAIAHDPCDAIAGLCANCIVEEVDGSVRLTAACYVDEVQP